jgi:4-amino-4-deoxy-L-arabinose transferase-like glycosyltransferase
VFETRNRSAAPFQQLRSGLITLVAFACLLGLFALQLWVHVTRTSATSDEPVHILGGYRYWECGEFVVNPQHPPLLKLLAAAPLRSRHLIEPDWPCGTRNPSWQEVEYAAARFVAQNGTDSILIPTRIAAALMSLLLAALVCLMAWEMFGRAEALVALAILVFEPTVIAHGSLVTTDMALTATTVLAVYALYRYGERPSVLRILAAGFAVGLMLGSKHSGMLVLPILLVLMLVDFVLGRRCKPEAATSVGRDVLRVGLAYVVVLLGALTIVWSVHGFRYYALPGATREVLPFSELFNPSGKDVVRSASAKLVELVYHAHIFPESYIFGLAYRIPTSMLPMYLFGKVYPTGRWFYFPVAFAIKSSLALLILLPLSLLTRGLYRTHPREMLFLLLPSLAYFAMSMASGFNIGVRHLLPAYAFFIVVAAAGACWWGRRHRAVFYALVWLLVFHAIAAARTAPSYIAFANDLWGGTRNTYRLLNDSNVEWGQNLKLVEAYLQDNGIHDCWFAAYGMADLVRPYKTCRKLPSFGWAATEHLVDLVPPVIEGTVLISAWELPPWGGQQYAPLVETQPVDVIGGSILVFRGRFEVPLASALSYASRADQLLGWQRYAEALQDARKAVDLGPNDPRTHWELAATAARNGLADEARQAAEAARRLAPLGPAYFGSAGGG